MHTLGQQQLWSFVEDGEACRSVESVTEIRKSNGHKVSSYLELATKVAELQFRNREHIFLLRGQAGDYPNFQRNSTLKPGLFRPETGKKAPPSTGVLVRRFETLKHAEAMLVEQFQHSGSRTFEHLQRYRILRWAILQHYEVCPTPLLDVTHSLRIAASFASQRNVKEAYIFVLGVPNLSGAITASAEAGVQIVRLASVCPPEAVRPHIQEGYLLGEYPELVDYNQKELYPHHEIDFGRRLLAKFRFNPRSFWKDPTFPKVPHQALYPNERRDPLLRLSNSIKKHLY